MRALSPHEKAAQDQDETSQQGDEAVDWQHTEN